MHRLGSLEVQLWGLTVCDYGSDGKVPLRRKLLVDFAWLGLYFVPVFPKGLWSTFHTIMCSAIRNTLRAFTLLEEE